MNSQTRDELVVYTTIFGEGYQLPEKPDSFNQPFICFTDQKKLDSNGWICRVVKPTFPLDLARSSREQKIRPHRWLSEYSKSLYIDPSVKLLSNPQNLWDFLMPNDHIFFGAAQHSYRQSLLEEFAVVIEDKLDNSDRVIEALNELVLTAPELLKQPPVWGGIIARRHHEPSCEKAMELWFSHVLRLSRRDQLSLPYVLSEVNSSNKSIVQLDNFESEFHVWPTIGYQRPARYYDKIQETVVSPMLNLEQRNRQLARERSQRMKVEKDFERIIVSHNNTVEALRKEIEMLEQSRGLRLTRALGQIRSVFSKNSNSAGNLGSNQ